MKPKRMMGGLTWFELGKRLWQDDCEVFARSAQLSYYFLFGLIPMLIFLTSVIGMLMLPETEMYQSLFSYLGNVMPETAFKLISETMKEIHFAGGGWKLYVGLGGALWAASSGMGAITTALNAAYSVRETRPWWVTRLIAIGLTLLLTLLILAALGLIFFGGKISDAISAKFQLGSWFGWIWKIGQWPVALAFLLFAFELVYYCSANQKHRTWHWISMGSIIGTILWLAASYGFRLYLTFYNSYIFN
jgi:membrane protein